MIKLIFHCLMLSFICPIAGAAREGSETAPPPAADGAIAGKEAGDQLQKAVDDYMARRRLVWKTRSFQDFTALFPQQYAKAFEQVRKEVETSVKEDMVDIRACKLEGLTSLDEAKLGKGTTSLLKGLPDVRFYRAVISIADGQQHKVVMGLIGGRLYQLENY